MSRRLALLAAFLLLTQAASAEEKPDKDGFVPLFNGTDLKGWVHVNDWPNTWSIRDNMIVTTGYPIGFLRTEKMYENFILEFEWNHRPRKDNREGNSGMFVWADPIPAQGQGSFARAIEVQVLVNLEWKDKKTGKSTATSHGDLFSIWGAKCVPDRPHPLKWERCIPEEKRAKGFGEWKHYRVVAKDGRIELTVNGGKPVSGVSKCKPRKGYLALEAEGNECWFRNLKIKELPSSNPRPEEIAMDGTGWERLYNGKTLEGWIVGDLLLLIGLKPVPVMLSVAVQLICMDGTGWERLYNGKTLEGWIVGDGHKGHWKPADFWRLTYDGKATGTKPDLWSWKEYGDFEMLADWRFPAKPVKKKWNKILPSGDDAEELIEVDDAGDSGIYLRGSSKSQVNMWCRPIGSGEVYGYRTDKKMPPEVRRAVTPKEKADKPLGQWNRFHITMKGDRLTVVLNGKQVIENAQLPGVAEKGPIALQHHGDPVEFGNLYIRELK